MWWTHLKLCVSPWKITTGTEGVEAAAEVEAQGGEGEVTVQGM